jgi:hypothetical protein
MRLLGKVFPIGSPEPHEDIDHVVGENDIIFQRVDDGWLALPQSGGDGESHPWQSLNWADAPLGAMAMQAISAEAVPALLAELASVVERVDPVRDQLRVWWTEAAVGGMPLLAYRTLRARACDTAGHSPHQADGDGSPGCLTCWRAVMTLAEAGLLTSPGQDKHYFDALDEIWRMRAVAAVYQEALSDVLRFKTLPVAARSEIARVRGRLAAVARGQARYWARKTESSVLKGALERLGESTTLTRHEWEHRTDG